MLRCACNTLVFVEDILDAQPIRQDLLPEWYTYLASRRIDCVRWYIAEDGNNHQEYNVNNGSKTPFEYEFSKTKQAPPLYDIWELCDGLIRSALSATLFHNLGCAGNTFAVSFSTFLGRQVDIMSGKHLEYGGHFSCGFRWVVQFEFGGDELRVGR